jgi:hypothetical protein
MAMGWTTEGSESRKGKACSLVHVVQTVSGVHPASIKWVPGCLSPGV